MGMLWKIVEGFGHVLFLPPYSPDLNPIEKSFFCSVAAYSSHAIMPLTGRGVDVKRSVGSRAGELK